MRPMLMAVVTAEPSTAPLRALRQMAMSPCDRWRNGVDYRIYLNLLSYRWTHQILTALSDHPRRFTEILHTISPAPSPKVLSESLIRLQEHNLIQRRTGDNSAPYDLTDAGYELLHLARTFLEELRRWGEEYVPAA